MKLVLILVVMDYSLVLKRAEAAGDKKVVLILVVMDYSLVRQYINLVTVERCLNPCCNGL